jgi:hypothetical protein
MDFDWWQIDDDTARGEPYLGSLELRESNDLKIVVSGVEKYKFGAAIFVYREGVPWQQRWQAFKAYVASRYEWEDRGIP